MFLVSFGDAQGILVMSLEVQEDQHVKPVLWFLLWILLLLATTIMRSHHKR